MNALQLRIANLYRTMPDARMPPWEEERGYLWGEVENTAQWEFCEKIVHMIEDSMTSHVYSLHRVEKDKP